MKGISEEAIKSAFTTVVNKLIFSKNDLLIPFVKAERECDGDGAQRIVESIERELNDNANKTQKLAPLVADGLLDPVKYRQALNELSAERTELTGKKEILINQLQHKNLAISEGSELLKRIRKKEVTDEFDDELFTECIKAVHIYSRDEFGFEFTCGLTFREGVSLK
jgi:superfamily II RNA helicase